MAILKYTDASGNVVKVNSYKVNNVVVSQSKGQSTAEVMSQKAVTDEIDAINADLQEINNTLGETASSDALGELENIVSLKANKSEVYNKTDADGKFQVKGNYLTQHQDISGKAEKSEVSAVDAKVDQNTADLTAEVTRATAKENELTTAVNSKADATDLTAEVSRATTAENTLTDNLAAEVTRATEAEEANAAEIAEIKAIRVIDCGTY